MAICIDGNFVCFDGAAGRFCATPTGLAFRGEASATCFCDLRTFQGSTSGYVAGGQGMSNTSSSRCIDKFPFASPGFCATVIGLLSSARHFQGGSTGASSDVNGYVYGGNYQAPGPPFTPPANIDNIEKFPFSSDTPATVTADIAQAPVFPSPGQAGVSNGASSDIAGGRAFVTSVRTTSPTTNDNCVDNIERFPFINDGNASNVGSLTKQRSQGSMQTSTTHGYVSGGTCVAPDFGLACIDKFPFSIDNTPSTNIADLQAGKKFGTGLSSETNGYYAGGFQGGSTHRCEIEKFPFSSDTNSSIVANLGFMCVSCGAGSSSTTGGYVSGGRGRTVPTPLRPEFDCAHRFVQCFPFASDADGQCVGDIKGQIPSPNTPPAPLSPALKCCLFGRVGLAGFQV